MWPFAAVLLTAAAAVAMTLRESPGRTLEHGYPPARSYLPGVCLYVETISLEAIMSLPSPPPWRMEPALRALAGGGVIAYPTEAVYGLGCLPDDELAVRALLRMKRRPVRKGLILVAADVAQLAPYIEFPDADVYERVLASWPGPVTWLLPATRAVPVWLRGEHATLAVRVSAHPVVRALSRAAGPLTSTSANPASAPPARSTLRVRAYFGGDVAVVVSGPLGGQARPTEIRDAASGRLIRSAIGRESQ